MLKIENLSFAYHNDPVLKNIYLEVDKGACVALMGPSGCGKSTLLEIIYGLHDVKANLFWKGQPILGPAYHLVPGMPYMKYVSQHFDLMPFITVAENIGKYVSNLDWEYKQKRVKELLQLVQMEEYANVKAKLLSGGQMQRVAIARALAQMPEVILLDEPFSHVDTALKNQLRRNLFTFFKENNITCLIATHDKEDVLPFADVLVVLEDGEILQVDSPKNVYFHPKSKAIASLFGDVFEVSPLLQDKWNLPKFMYENTWEISDIGIQTKVKYSRFIGDGYLNECIVEEKVLYFKTVEKMKVGKEIFINKKPLVQSN